MRRLKLPQSPKILPEPLSEEEIQKVLAASLDTTRERFAELLHSDAFSRYGNPAG